MFDWTGHDTEKACSVIVHIDERPAEAIRILAKATPTPIGAIPWGAGKWRVVYANETTATDVVAQGSTSSEGKVYTVKPPGMSYTYRLSTPYLLLKEAHIRHTVLRAAVDRGEGKKIFSIRQETAHALATGKWMITTDFRLPPLIKSGENRIQAFPVLPNPTPTTDSRSKRRRMARRRREAPQEQRPDSPAPSLREESREERRRSRNEAPAPREEPREEEPPPPPAQAIEPQEQRTPPPEEKKESEEEGNDTDATEPLTSEDEGGRLSEDELEEGEIVEDNKESSLSRAPPPPTANAPAPETPKRKRDNGKGKNRESPPQPTSKKPKKKGRPPLTPSSHKPKIGKCGGSRNVAEMFQKPTTPRAEAKNAQRAQALLSGIFGGDSSSSKTRPPDPPSPTPAEKTDRTLEEVAKEVPCCKEAAKKAALP